MSVIALDGQEELNQENLERVSFPNFCNGLPSFPTYVNSNLCCQGCWGSMTDYFCKVLILPLLGMAPVLSKISKMTSGTDFWILLTCQQNLG